MREEWYNLSFSIESNVGIINLNDKENNNTISAKFLRELKNGLKVFHHSNDVKVIVIKGDNGTFSSGINTNELVNSKEDLNEFGHFGWKVFNKFSEIQKPVIAEVQGKALDAGFELALMADLVYISEDATFGFPGIKNSITPAFGGISQLLHIAGMRYTKELLYTGRIITAQEAVTHSIANKIFPTNTLHQEVLSICEEIIKTPVTILGGLKQASGKITDVLKRIHMQDEISIFENFKK